MSRDFEPNDLEFEPQETDEQEALATLDDTTIRPMPEMSAVWEPLEPTPAPSVPERPARLRTRILVGAVAIVSFVAGGLTARLSSQMPVLFTERPAPVESTASYQEPVAPAHPVAQESEPAPEPDPEPTDERIVSYPPSYDTGYDTTDDTSADKSLDDDDDDDADTPDDGSEFRWDFDSEGDRSISYDTNRDRVTVDYDDNSFTLDLDNLLGDNTTRQETDSDRYVTYSEPTYTNDWGTDNGYGTGTGDDVTAPERDVYGWRGWSYTNREYDYHT